jgi:Ca-activated chloride channel family protein
MLRAPTTFTLPIPFLWPSWGGSIVVHIVLLLLILFNTRSCVTSKGIQADGNPVREAGIYVKAAEPTNSPLVSEENGKSTAEMTNATNQNPTPASKQQTASQQASQNPSLNMDIPLQLPEMPSIPAIGFGQLPSNQSVSQQMEQISHLPNSTKPTGAAAIPAGTVEFFNVKESGRSFVFLIDMSDSMYEYSALTVAKREVLANLNQLETDQQFQIIFYNEFYLEMTNHLGKKEFSFANPVNLSLARNFVQERQPNNGTDHFPALMKALSYGPEVLFFLTDAAEPELSAKQMETLRKLNNGRTKIHCIHFSKGPDLGVDNFLKRLAKANGGTYRYRDVTRFGGAPLGTR